MLDYCKFGGIILLCFCLALIAVALMVQHPGGPVYTLHFITHFAGDIGMKLPHTIRIAPVIFGAAALLLANTSHAVDPDIVEKAWNATFGNPSAEDWAYTETTVANGREKIGRFDPRRPEGERWHLISIGGRPPTEKERKEDAEKRKADRERPNSGRPDGKSNGSDSMIQPESLSLVEETAAHIIYRFKPVANDEDGAKFFEYIDATLKIVKDGPYVASVDMRSVKPFKPGLGARIDTFVTALSFKPVAANGAILIHTAKFRMLGRVWVVKKIDEQVDVSYTDYEFVGDKANAAP